MIPLVTRGRVHRLSEPLVAKVMDGSGTSWPSRVALASSLDDVRAAGGADAVLCEPELSADALRDCDIPVVHGINLTHVAAGDVVNIDPRGDVRTLYRRASRYNALFATDRCNSLCLMCSQPPRQVNDDWRVEHMLRTIGLIDRDTPELGITGGEPTLLGDGFIRVLRACKEQLPDTSVHVLSNGRLFRYGRLARSVAQVRHPDLMIGIPLYADNAPAHDYVVQSKGAFDDTVAGLLNLAREDVPVELRVVLHRHTYARLPELADFIYRTFTFASHVTFMAMEMMGFAVANLDSLWIDPWNYRAELTAATLHLAQRGMNVSIYNHQLCTVDEAAWPYCRKSISDWKNDYLPQCAQCVRREQCGGFFSSAVQRRFSDHISPLT